MDAEQEAFIKEMQKKKPKEVWEELWNRRQEVLRLTQEVLILRRQLDERY